MHQSSTTEELRAWLRLSLEPHVGPVQARSLLSAIGLPHDVYAASSALLARHIPADLARQLRQSPTTETLAAIEHTMQWLEQPQHHLLTLADSEYPRSLLDIHDPPLVLYAKGKVSLLTKPGLAVVGARSATAGGLENARAFARHLADQGWSIVSGLARGIDAAAHEGAMLAGPEGGSTIAVLGTGIDIVYPARHHELAHRIADEGLLISELPLGTRALPYQFPKRNRLVAGLSQGVLVVEAARQSGSLITARLAGELGREVFAIPGSIHSPLSRGCHALIRQGAKLVETAADIHDELRPPEQERTSPPQGGHTKQGAKSASVPAGRTEPGASPASASASRTGPSVSPASAPSGHRQKRRAGTSSATLNQQPLPMDDESAAVLDALGYDPVHPDVLLQRTGWDMTRLTPVLLQLELAEAVARLSDGCYQRL